MKKVPDRPARAPRGKNRILVQIEHLRAIKSPWQWRIRTIYPPHLQTRPQSAHRRRIRLQSNPHRGTKSFWSAIRGVGEAPARFGAGEQHAVHRRRGVPGNIRPYGECTDADPCWCQMDPGAACARFYDSHSPAGIEPMPVTARRAFEFTQAHWHSKFRVSNGLTLSSSSLSSKFSG